MSRSTRDSEARIHEERPEYSMDYMSPLSIPFGVEREGFTQRWVNTGIKGEANFRVEEMASKGWTLVPADRAPGRTLDPLGRNPLSGKYIAYKDVILMERPDIYTKKETEAFNYLNANKIRSLRGVASGNSNNSVAYINSF
jgi:hypothetical protein